MIARSLASHTPVHFEGGARDGDWGLVVRATATTALVDGAVVGAEADDDAALREDAAPPEAHPLAAVVAVDSGAG